jgi:hypothetical protein
MALNIHLVVAAVYSSSGVSGIGILTEEIGNGGGSPTCGYGDLRSGREASVPGWDAA